MGFVVLGLLAFWRFVRIKAVMAVNGSESDSFMSGKHSRVLNYFHQRKCLSGESSSGRGSRERQQCWLSSYTCE